VSSHPTHLGDLVRVVHALHPRPEELVLISEMLADHDPHGVRAGGARPAADDDEPVGRREPGERSPRAGSAPRRPRPRTSPQRQRPSLSFLALNQQARWERTWWVAVVVVVLLLVGLWATGVMHGRSWLAVVVVLITIRPALGGLAMWWRSAQHYSLAERAGGGLGAAGDELEVVPLDHASWQPPPESQPLVRPGQQRAVAMLLAGRSAPGPIDLVTTVRKVAARQPLTAVPRHPGWSTNLGLLLHVDRGPALEPFRDDIAQLRRALIAVASRHAVDEIGFDGDPRWITWPRRVAGPGRPLPLASRLPAPGTPVLAITDLGITVPRSGLVREPHAFLEHHDTLVQAGCDVQYLVPYPPDRWPPALADLPIVHWSDDLGVSAVLACIRRRRHAA
jgi:hypothetical protein